MGELVQWWWIEEGEFDEWREAIQNCRKNVRISPRLNKINIHAGDRRDRKGRTYKQKYCLSFALFCR